MFLQNLSKFYDRENERYLTQTYVKILYTIRQ